MSDTNSKLPVYSWNIHGEGSWHAYKSGYRRAIDKLIVDALESTGPIIQDPHRTYGAIYPIAFLCRHYVELEMKQVLALASLMSIPKSGVKHGHKLNSLWPEVLACVEFACGSDVRQEFKDTLGTLIDDLEKLDPVGDGFRYPTNSKGQAQWVAGFEMDIKDLKSRIAEFENRFHDLLTELKQMLDPECDDISSRSYYY